VAEASVVWPRFAVREGTDRGSSDAAPDEPASELVEPRLGGTDILRLGGIGPQALSDHAGTGPRAWQEVRRVHVLSPPEMIESTRT
jgi:hypothetical protein